MSVPLPVPERISHPFVTHEMIMEIPQAIEATLKKNKDKVKGLAKTRLKGKENFYFTGCGTAFFGSMLGEQLFSLAKDEVRSSAVQASELSNYGRSITSKCATIGVSHSGITKQTIDALKYAKENGAYTVGVTHFTERPISGVVDVTLVAGNSPDRSRCHTKCYVAAGVACMQIAIETLRSKNGLTGRLEAIEDELEAVPRITSKLLGSVENKCKQMADEHLSKRSYYFVGSGPNVSTALEAALKIKETSYVPAEGLQTEQLVHGAWVVLGSDSLLLVVAPAGKTYRRSTDLIRAGKRVGASVIAITDREDKEIASLCDGVIEVPSVDEYLSPIVNILPLYLFSYYSSVKRGFNPDLLRYLTPSYWEARQIVFPPGTH